jgi:hypothetical protein
MPVNARRMIRKMRGGAQAHLIEADDGRFYVVKFRNNPQHRRILINEWLGGSFLEFLGVAVPDRQIVNIPEGFLAEYPDTGIQLGTRRIPPLLGWHFGSLFPGHPDRVAVYDFLPDSLLDSVENARDFLTVLLVDKWAGNVDARQSVFLRARVSQYVPDAGPRSRRTGFVALMIDHGYFFNGPHWEYVDSPAAGLYFRASVYRSVRSIEDFCPALDRITAFPADIIDESLRHIPPDWLEGDSDELERLLERLMDRRARVPELLHQTRRAGLVPFPAWTD